MSNLQDLQQLAEKRRSIYALSNQLPVSNDEVVKLLNMLFCTRHQRSIHSQLVLLCCLVTITTSFGISPKRH